MTERKFKVWNDGIVKPESFMVMSEKRDRCVFKGTDIPISYLWDSLINGESIEDFINEYPEIDKEYILNVLRNGAKLLEEHK